MATIVDKVFSGIENSPLSPELKKSAEVAVAFCPLNQSQDREALAGRVMDALYPIFSKHHVPETEVSGTYDAIYAAIR
ncbi:MAG TPA: hypothetical protein VJI46_05485 [Candidatus Nanoarchaeia archaeon]|nr:hypothetical protein [Candidatus Nanoarchaeia archaeon]